MSKLYKTLIKLNSSDTQQGIWVSPENPTEEFRFGQNCFENGGILDGWVCIGNLEDLSFGYQSEHDAFACFVSSGASSEKMPKSVQGIIYKGKVVNVNPQALYEAYCENDRIDEDFSDFISHEIELIQSQWADYEAQDFISNKLPTIIGSKLQECA